MKRDAYVLTIEDTGGILVHPDRRFARFIKALGRRYGWKVRNIRYAKPNGGERRTEEHQTATEKRGDKGSISTG